MIQLILCLAISVVWAKDSNVLVIDAAPAAQKALDQNLNPAKAPCDDELPSPNQALKPFTGCSAEQLSKLSMNDYPETLACKGSSVGQFKTLTDSQYQQMVGLTVQAFRAMYDQRAKIAEKMSCLLGEKLSEAAIGNALSEMASKLCSPNIEFAVGCFDKFSNKEAAAEFDPEGVASGKGHGCTRLKPVCVVDPASPECRKLSSQLDPVARKQISQIDFVNSLVHENMHALTNYLVKKYPALSADPSPESRLKACPLGLGPMPAAFPIGCLPNGRLLKKGVNSGEVLANLRTDTSDFDCWRYPPGGRIEQYCRIKPIVSRPETYREQCGASSGKCFDAKLKNLFSIACQATEAEAFLSKATAGGSATLREFAVVSRRLALNAKLLESASSEAESKELKAERGELERSRQSLLSKLKAGSSERKTADAAAKALKSCETRKLEDLRASYSGTVEKDLWSKDFGKSKECTAPKSYYSTNFDTRNYGSDDKPSYCRPDPQFRDEIAARSIAALITGPAGCETSYPAYFFNGYGEYKK